MKHAYYALTLVSGLVATTCAATEADFSRQWGAMGTLHQAPTYFKSYVPKKKSCHKKQKRQVPAQEVPAVADQKKA